MKLIIGIAVVAVVLAGLVGVAPPYPPLASWIETIPIENGILVVGWALLALIGLPTGAKAAWRELAKAWRAPRPRAFLVLLALALIALPFAPFALGDSPLWPSAGLMALVEAFTATLVLTVLGIGSIWG